MKALVVFVFCLAIITSSIADGVDDKMKELAHDIGYSLKSISDSFNHHLDWMFVVDHGGLESQSQHDYTKYFIRELASHLYISPSHSLAGLITYDSQAYSQIPLDKDSASSCSFKQKLHSIAFRGGQSDLTKGLNLAVNELTTNGRSSVHKVTVLVTTAGWENVGTNPYESIKNVKDLGTLMVFVLVFDRQMSIFSPVIMGLASPRLTPTPFKAEVRRYKRQLSTDHYAFELEAQPGNLRRLYRHFLLDNQKMAYLPLQVPLSFCLGGCLNTHACVCDTALSNSYHCEKDALAPLIVEQCPSDMAAFTQPDSQYSLINWKAPTAKDFSNSLQTRMVFSKPFNGVVNSNINASGTFYFTQLQIGVTNVTHSFFDVSGNEVSCSFLVTVYDTQPPTLPACPSVIMNTTGNSTQEYLFNISATDNSDQPIKTDYLIDGVTYPLTMKSFPIGRSEVTLVFSDSSANVATCQFNVTVQDFESPEVVSCDGPAQSMIWSGGLQVEVTWPEPVFRDNSGQPVRVRGDSKPGFYRLGEHNVTYTGTDPSGNVASCTFTFLVSGFPCAPLDPPLNGAMVCDNAVPGGVCQMFCQHPYDFEPLSAIPNPPEKYICQGRGVWHPTTQVPHCVVNQKQYRKMPDSYYYSGNCSKHNVSAEIKDNAVSHFSGFLEGRYFREAWQRDISLTDFDDPVCGSAAPITTTIPTTSTTTTPTTTTTTTSTTSSTVPSTTATTLTPRSRPTNTNPLPTTTRPSTTGSSPPPPDTPDPTRRITPTSTAPVVRRDDDDIFVIGGK